MPDNKPGADVHAVHLCKVDGGIFSAEVALQRAYSRIAHKGAALLVAAEVDLWGFRAHLVGEIAHLNRKGRAFLMKRHRNIGSLRAVQREINMENVLAKGGVLREAEPRSLVTAGMEIIRAERIRKRHLGRIRALRHDEAHRDLIAGRRQLRNHPDYAQSVRAVDYRNAVPAGSAVYLGQVGLICGEIQPVALAYFVELLAGAVRRADVVDRFAVLLCVLQAEVRAVGFLKALAALDHAQLAYHRGAHAYLATHVVKRHSGLHREGNVVVPVNAQPADHARAVQRPVQQSPLVVEIPLLGLEIPGGEHFSVKIPVSLKRKEITVVHRCFLLK